MTDKLTVNMRFQLKKSKTQLSLTIIIDFVMLNPFANRRLAVDAPPNQLVHSHRFLELPFVAFPITPVIWHFCSLIVMRTFG